MKAVEIIEIIEKTAPLGAAAPWDASGVQVAGMYTAVTRVAVMLDPTLKQLTAAADYGADFVLAHHPLSMKPRFPNRQDEYQAVLSLLFTRGMWLYSAHTSLDANPQGPVRWLARELGLGALRLLEPCAPGAEEYGFGFVGDLAQPLAYDAFCRLLANAAGRGDWLACGPKPVMVARAACCPGSGGGLLEAASHAGADVFVTGDVKYHAALEAESRGLRVLDLGHFSLEEEMMRRFALDLERELAVPVRFFPGTDPICPEGGA